MIDRAVVFGLAGAGSLLRAGALGIAIIVAEGCGDAPPGERPAAPPDMEATDEARPERTDLVDPAIPPAVAGDEEWMYSRSAEADLDADEVVERVVLTARAELVRGRPAWDDGQPWQVYVEEPTGERTYLYSRYVQLGSVSMRIGLGEAGRSPGVVLLEQVPDRLAVYEVVYRGPGQVELRERLERSLDPRGEVSSPVLP